MYKFFLPSKLLSIITVIILTAPFVTYGQTTLSSSVSPEFKDGLQKKYLNFIAEKMEHPLSVYPINYNQRIELLRAGKIDIMVGLKAQHPENNDFIYLHPSYEKLTNNVFVLKENKNKYKALTDLKNTTIAFTPDKTQIAGKINQMGINLMPAPYLKQKIELLLKGRVDALVYFKESTLTKLKEMGLENEVVQASLPAFSVREHFVAISLKSPFIKQKDKLTTIIKDGVKNGDFKRIRQKHYLTQ